MDFVQYSGRIIPSEYVAEEILSSAERDNVPFKVRKKGANCCYIEGCSCLENVLSSPMEREMITICRNIAFSSSRPIGAVIYAKTRNYNEKVGSIDFLYVKSEEREKGLGNLLMQNATIDLKDYGARGVYMEIINLCGGKPNVPMIKIAKKFLDVDDSSLERGRLVMAKMK